MEKKEGGALWSDNGRGNLEGERQVVPLKLVLFNFYAFIVPISKPYPSCNKYFNEKLFQATNHYQIIESWKSGNTIQKDLLFLEAVSIYSFC